MSLAEAIPAVLQRVEREDGGAPGDWEGARAEALQGMKQTLVAQWGEDPGDPRFVDGLLVGAILAYTSACEGYDAQQMTLQAYLLHRERVVRAIQLWEGLQALVQAGSEIIPKPLDFTA